MIYFVIYSNYQLVLFSCNFTISRNKNHGEKFFGFYLENSYISLYARIVARLFYLIFLINRMLNLCLIFKF